MHLNSNKIRQEIELIFERYRKHKYYTLFINDYNTNVTSQIDDVGGGKSNLTTNKVANHVVSLLDKKDEARQYVGLIECAVDQLPKIEREVIRKRYMTKNHDYINDYTVYELRMDPPISRPTYIKLRERAFDSLYKMLV